MIENNPRLAEHEPPRGESHDPDEQDPLLHKPIDIGDQNASTNGEEDPAHGGPPP